MAIRKLVDRAHPNSINVALQAFDTEVSDQITTAQAELQSSIDEKADASHTHAQADVTNLVTDLAAKVPTSRTITAGAGLTGGGDLSANRTLAVSLPVTDVAYDSGDFGSSGGTWTVQSGDLAAFQYQILDKLMWVSFRITASTFSSTPSELQIDIPNGQTAAEDAVAIGYCADGAAAPSPTVIRATAGSTELTIRPIVGGSWTDGSNLVEVAGQIWFEVQ